MLPSLSTFSVLLQSQLQPCIKHSKGLNWAMPPQTSALATRNADGYGCSVSLALSNYVLKQRGLLDGDTKKTLLEVVSQALCQRVFPAHDQGGREGSSTELMRPE